MSILSQAYFHNEAAAFAKLESIVWPSGPVCPHCGNAEKIYDLKGVRSKPSKKNPRPESAHIWVGPELDEAPGSTEGIDVVSSGPHLFRLRM